MRFRLPARLTAAVLALLAALTLARLPPAAVAVAAAATTADHVHDTGTRTATGTGTRTLVDDEDVTARTARTLPHSEQHTEHPAPRDHRGPAFPPPRPTPHPTPARHVPAAEPHGDHDQGRAPPPSSGI